MCKDDTFTANTCLMSHTGRMVEPMEPWNCTIERLKSSLCGIREVFFYNHCHCCSCVDEILVHNVKGKVVGNGHSFDTIQALIYLSIARLVIDSLD